MSKDDPKSAGSAERPLHVIGVPLDHGAGRRGVSMGPTSVRIAGLNRVLARAGFGFVEHGDIEVSIPETLPSGDVNARYLSSVAETCEQLHQRVKSALDSGGLPLVIGGDHSIAIGSLAGVSHHLKALDVANGLNRVPKVGVLWFDAHADINTPETSPSGNIHGMPVACSLGAGPSELTDIGFPGPKIEAQRVVQVGLRDIDRHEKRLIREHGIHAYTMADIDRRGMAPIVEEAIEIALRDCDLLHVSFDVDVLDPSIAPGTGTPVLGGLSYREAHLALEMVAATGQLRSLEVVEVNPVLDQGNRTAEVAVGLIASALGKTIL